MPDPNHLVSVIIPYYNRPKKLERCLTSVWAQTHPQVEVIVVDDASTIPPQDKDPRATFLRNDCNKGPGVSRNLGMAKAQGKYIAFLDSDDYWAPTFLTTLVTLLEENPMAAMAYSKVFLIDENNEVVGVKRKAERLEKTIVPAIFSERRAWATSSCVWKLEYCAQVSWPATRVWEDYAFDTAVAVMQNTVVGTLEKLVYYDSSGADKLSAVAVQHQLVEKAESLMVMATTLASSTLQEDPLVKHHFRMLLTNILIRGTKRNLDDREEIKMLWEVLKKGLAAKDTLALSILQKAPHKARLKGLKLWYAQQRKKYE